MNRIGIMQGRLLPPIEGKIQAFPRDNWADEFPAAQQAGLQTIEWIYESYGMDVNPLASDEGIARMAELSAKHGVRVVSVCADYFMEEILLRAPAGVIEKRLEKFVWLLGRCSKAGMERAVLPFVDNSEIRDDVEFAGVRDVLRRIMPEAERLGVEVHLETSLAPPGFRELLGEVDHPYLKVNYDIGNSASLGYDPREEFEAYGEYVGSVHIKDRIKGGTTVPPGEGDADFDYCFSALKSLGYAGDFVLQVARGKEGDEVNWARKNREFVLSHWA